MNLRRLAIALHAEGPSDEEFLQPLLTRLVPADGPVALRVSTVLVAKGRRSVPEVVKLAGERFADGVFDVLCIHRDADSRNKESQQRAVAGAICAGMLNDHALPAERCVRIVPMRETEAWCFADPEALRRELDVPELPPWLEGLDISRPEAITDAKKELSDLFARVMGRGRKVTPPFAELGSKVSFARLRRLPAFQSFERDFTASCRAIIR